MEKTHKRLPVPLMSLGRTIFRQFPNCAQVTFESMKNQGCNRFWERMLNQILIFWKFFQLRNKRTAHTRRLFRKPTLETNFLYIVVFHFTVFILTENVLLFFGFHCVTSFIACAQISFMIAIYVPEDFFLPSFKSREKKNSNGKMKRINKKSSYLLLLV